MHLHDVLTGRILARMEADERVTQRRLAGELGIALGLTNLLIRRIVKKGWVKAVSVRPKRVRYLITPEGIAERARVTRAYFENTLSLYTETRERIRRSLARLSATWPAGVGEKRIVFYGASEVAEIAYICLDGTDLRLVGVVDDVRRTPFLGTPVHPATALTPTHLDGKAFGRVAVMSFRRADDIRRRLEDIGYPDDRIFWLD
jgi:DNA-binding MarR family transcriptional regulator